MAANDGEHPVTSLFGADVPAGTGAPGSATNPDTTVGAVISSPVVSNPFGSSQAAENMPRVPVTTGDTCSLSSDAPVPPSGDPLTGLPLSFIAATGAGDGSAGHHNHPNAGGRP